MYIQYVLMVALSVFLLAVQGNNMYIYIHTFISTSYPVVQLTVKLKKKRRTMQSSAVATHKVQLSGLGLEVATEEDPAIR